MEAVKIAIIVITPHSTFHSAAAVAELGVGIIHFTIPGFSIGAVHLLRDFQKSLLNKTTAS